MGPKEFTYWLQGFFEIQNPEKLNKEHTQIIKDHLKLVFDKKTPDRNPEKVRSDWDDAKDDFDELFALTDDSSVEC